LAESYENVNIKVAHDEYFLVIFRRVKIEVTARLEVSVKNSN